MRSSQTISEIAKALSKAQGELENPTKNATGYGYKYAKLDEIINVIREPLEKNNLSIIHTMDWGDAPKMTTTLLHSSGEWLACDCPLRYAKSEKTNEMQAIGSSITYGRKYNIQCLLNLYAEDDDGKSSGPRKESNAEDEDDISRLKKEPYEPVRFEPKKQSFPDRKVSLKAKIGEDQAKSIEAMLVNRPADRERLYKWKGIARVEELLAEDYQATINALSKVQNG